jgi:hypothetical protein
MTEGTVNNGATEQRGETEYIKSRSPFVLRCSVSPLLIRFLRLAPLPST